MGRKRHEIISGTTNWHPSIPDIPSKTLMSTRIIAAKQNIHIGILLRNWIVEGVAKSEKQLNKKEGLK